MKTRYIITAVILILGIVSMNAQEVKSVKTSLRISNIPEPVVVEIPDTAPPVIEFITPKIQAGTRYVSKLPKMNLVGKAVDSSKISFVSVNSEIQSMTESGIFTTELSLQPGDNQILLVAMDEKENLNELIFQVEYIPLVPTLAEKISEGSTYYGLIIGIDQYRDKEISDLDNPISDAKSLYETLVTNYQFEEENMRFLKNATRAVIIRNLDELARTITQEDNLLIFYAGHGWWDKNSKNGYWLPADSHRDEKTNWFRNSTLVDYLKDIHSKHTLLITDACFGGSIFQTRSAFGSREKAYEKLYELNSRKAMTSGNISEEVPDNSKFTEYLIRELKKNKGTYLSAEELFSNFNIIVANNTDALPRFGEIRNVGDMGGDFIFLKRQTAKETP
ncbi:MAG: caspase family protein [Bacteroidetes bacterium]|nr:caspase family protein [Bacteroidota bacterium]